MIMNFSATPAETALLGRVLARAQQDLDLRDPESTRMDLIACHKYGAPLDFQKLLGAPQGDGSDPDRARELIHECYQGEFVGDLIHCAATEVTPLHMAELLSATGSEPEFFGLGDMTQLVENLADSADDAGCDGDLIVCSKADLNALLEGTGLPARFDIEEGE